MARQFDITTTGDTVTVDSSGSTRVVFTVTNTTQKPLRASLRAKALDSTQAGWLSIGGDAERDFPPGFTHQVELGFKAPAGTAAGPYRCRLDAVSVANPDDDVAEGPPVSVAVKADAAPVAQGSLWWVWAITGFLVLAVIGMVAWLALRNKAEPPAPTRQAVVPNGLAGQPYDAAKKQLEALGFTVRRENRPIIDDCPDKVLDSNPTAGVSAQPGSPITLSVGILASGPQTCKAGFVWREAFQGDTTCVPPPSRTRASQDNQLNPTRVEQVPGTAKDIEEIQRTNPQARVVPKGDFRALARLDSRIVMVPHLPAQFPTIQRCKAGYFERRASPTDRVCVGEATQLATAEENQLADSRKACLRK